MSDPSSPGGPYDRLDPDEARTTRIDFGQTPAGAPNTPWSAPQGDWGSPTPEPPAAGGETAADTPRAVGWGAPSPQAGWTPLPGGGWRPPQGNDATFIAPPRQSVDPPLPPDDGLVPYYHPTTDTPRRKHRLARVGATALLVVAGTFLGIAISHDFWQSHPTTTSQTQPAGGSGSTASGGSTSATRRLRLERLVCRRRSGSGSSPFGNGYRSSSTGSSSGGSLELGLGRAERRDVDRRGGRPGPRRHQRHAGLPVRPGGRHRHRAQLVGPGAHQQPRGQRRDQPSAPPTWATARPTQATVVGYDRSHDIAVIQLSGASGLKTAKLGDSSKAAVGDACRRHRQRRRRRRHAQRGRRLARRPRPADRRQRRATAAPSSSPA